MDNTLWGIGDAGYRGADPSLRVEFAKTDWMSPKQYAWNYALHSVRQTVERGIKRMKLFKNLSLVPWQLDINSEHEEEYHMHHQAIKIAAHTTNILLEHQPLSKFSHALLWTSQTLDNVL